MPNSREPESDDVSPGQEYFDELDEPSVSEAPAKGRRRTYIDDLGSIVFFGLGFYWAWLWVFEETPVVGFFRPDIFPGGQSIEPVTDHLVCALVLLIGAWQFERLRERRYRGWLVGLGAGAAALSTILGGLANAHVGSGGLAVVSLAFAGLARACFNMLWAVFYSRLGLKRGAVFMFGSVAVGASICLMVTALQPGISLAIETFLPILVAWTFVRSSGHLDQLEEEAKGSAALGEPASSSDETWIPQQFSGEKGGFPFRLFSRLFIGIFIYAAAFMFVASQSFSTKAGFASYLVFEYAFLGTIVLGIVLSAIAYNYPQRFNLLAAYRLVLPIVTMGFLFATLLDGGVRATAVGFVFVGFTVFDVVTWLALAYASRHLSLSPLRVFGYGRATHFLGLSLGLLLGGMAGQPGGGPSSLFIPFSLGFIGAIIIASTLILSERFLFASFPSSWGKRPAPIVAKRKKPAVGELVQEPIASEDAARDMWLEQCARIAADYGLTAREQEVLTYLARGRDTAYIEKSLGVSSHTVRSHVYHIYQKVGAHSRQDILDLVEFADSSNSDE